MRTYGTVKIEEGVYYNPAKRLMMKTSPQFDPMAFDHKHPYKKTTPLKRELSTDLTLILSYQCNLKCVYCSSNAGDQKENSKLNAEAFKPAIDHIIKNAIMARALHRSTQINAHVTITGGGEPTMAWDRLVDITRYIEQLNSQHEQVVVLKIVTNAQMDADKMQYLMKHFHHISVSTDGRQVQDLQRPRRDGHASWEAVAHFLKLLQENKKDFGIRMTITGLGIEQLEQDVDYFLEQYPQVQVLQIEPFAYIGRAKESTLIPLEQEIFAQTYQKLVQKYPQKLMTFVTSLENRYGYPCHKLSGLGSVLIPNGQLMACDSITPAQEESQNYAVGEVLDGKVWFLREPEMHDLPLECQHCFAVSFCNGGCPMRVARDPMGNIRHPEGKYHCENLRVLLKNTLLRKLDQRGVIPNPNEDAFNFVEKVAYL